MVRTCHAAAPYKRGIASGMFGALPTARRITPDAILHETRDLVEAHREALHDDMREWSVSQSDPVEPAPLLYRDSSNLADGAAFELDAGVEGATCTDTFSSSTTTSIRPSSRARGFATVVSTPEPSPPQRSASFAWELLLSTS